MTDRPSINQLLVPSRRWAWLVFALTFLGPVSLSAQPDASITGTVVASPGGEKIGGAEVLIVGQGILDLTTNDGTFTLSGIAPGRLTLLVRRIGFRPISISLKLAAGKQIAITSPIALLPDPTVLEEIVAEAEQADRRWRLADFERRRFRGIGRFLTQKEIDRRDAHLVADMLREMAGVDIMYMRTGQKAVTFRRGVRPCIPTVWLNGMRIRGTALSDDGLPGGASRFAGQGIAIGAGLQVSELNSPRFDNRAPVDIDQIVSTRDLGGIEVYAGLSEIPVEFQDTGNTCGAVVLWTR